MAVTLTANDIVAGINSVGWNSQAEFATAMKLMQLLTQKALLERQLVTVNATRANDNAGIDSQEATGLAALEATRKSKNDVTGAAIDAINAQIAAIDALIHP